VRDHIPDVVIERVGTTYEDARNYRVSTEKAEMLLGFTPEFTVDEGIEEIRMLVHSGRLGDVDNPRYGNKRFLSLHQTHIDPTYEQMRPQEQYAQPVAA